MENQLVKFESPELLAIEPSRAAQIKQTFEPMVQMLEDFEAKYNEIIAESEFGITKELTEKAKRVRLDIAKVRINTGKLKDKQKEYIKLEDKAIMGVHNILVFAVKEREDRLKGIEDYFEIQEAKRLEALQAARAEALSPYVEDAHERKLSEMDEDVWQVYFAAKVKEHNDRIEAERKAEEERIAREKAEAEERERIRQENERLKAEAEARAKEEAERRANEEAERKEREEKERKEREAYEAALKAEREERERIQREEQAKREALEAELKAKQEAERIAKEQELARVQEELSKGDADKVSDLVSDLQSIKVKYTFDSDANKKMYDDVCVLIDKVVNFIEKNVG